MDKINSGKGDLRIFNTASRYLDLTRTIGGVEPVPTLTNPLQITDVNFAALGYDEDKIEDMALKGTNSVTYAAAVSYTY
jgi:hypothetical protein